MKRTSARVQQRKRQTWLTLPASGIEELDHGQEWTRAIGEGRREMDSVRREGIAAPGQARHTTELDELMAWNDITEINEAVQNLILNAHALGPTLSFQAMESPRHKVQISENMTRMFRDVSLAELRHNPGDGILRPPQRPR